MKFFVAAIVASILLFAASCGGEGVAPFEDLIPFPTDIALYSSSETRGEGETSIPVAEYAYVVATNFNLTFNSGAVKVIDLALLDDLMREDAARSVPIRDRKFPPEIPTPFSEAILQGAGVYISNFGGEIKVMKDSKKGSEIAFVSVRENNSVTPLRIESGGAKLSCFIGDNRRECFREQSLETGRDDPFGMLIMNVPTLNNPLGSPFLFTSHLRKGEIIFWGLDDFIETRDKTRLEEGRSVVLSRSYGSAEMIYAPETGLVYTNSRTRDLGSFNTFSIFDPIKAITIGERSYVDEYIDVSSVIGGQELRGMAISPNGKWLYALSRGPDAAFILDLTLRPTGAGPKNRIVAVRPVDDMPSRVSYVNLGEGRDILVVTCTEGDSIYVLDARTLDIIQVLQNIGDAPFAAAIYRRPSLSGGGYSIYAMISNFEESTLTVLLLDAKTRMFSPVARIGAARNRIDDFK